jgi:hypothetical protein
MGACNEKEQEYLAESKFFHLGWLFGYKSKT